MKLSSQAFDAALKASLRLLQRRQIPYMVMGGLGLSVWGRVRVTQDVDLVIGLHERDEEDFINGLIKAHFLPAAPKAIVGHRLLVCRYLKTTKGLPIEVDFFFARGAYQKQALRRAIKVALGRLEIRVIAPEDLILHKLLADRPIDRLDVQTIFEEQAGRLNTKYLTRWARRLGFSAALATLLKGSKSKPVHVNSGKI